MFRFFSRQPAPPSAVVRPDLEEWLQKFAEHIELAYQYPTIAGENNQPPKFPILELNSGYDPKNAYVEMRDALEMALAEVHKANECLKIAERLWPGGHIIFRELWAYSDAIFLMFVNLAKINELLGKEDSIPEFARDMAEVGRLRQENWQLVRKADKHGNSVRSKLRATTGIELR